MGKKPCLIKGMGTMLLTHPLLSITMGEGYGKALRVKNWPAMRIGTDFIQLSILQTSVLSLDCSHGSQ